jgi:ectoine/hydroxyectoine ABC transporter permease protein EhuD
VQGFLDLFHFEDSLEYIPALLFGAIISIELCLIVMALSLVLGLFVALARLSATAALRKAAKVYVEAIRGTPALLQLFYIYFVFPSFGLRLSAFAAGVIGLTLNYAAYLSEVYRSGINAVPSGQVEAAKSLGLNRRLALRFVILPQAIRIIVPPLGNYFISLFKDTALVSTITVKELMFTGQIIASLNFQYFTIFTIIGVIYFGISYLASLAVQYLEHRLAVRTSTAGGRA